MVFSFALDKFIKYFIFVFIQKCQPAQIRLKLLAISAPLVLYKNCLYVNISFKENNKQKFKQKKFTGRANEFCVFFNLLFFDKFNSVANFNRLG